MPLYEYRCPDHGTFDSFTAENWTSCPNCGGRAQRRWSFQKPRQVLRHFNHSVGEWVEDHADFDKALRRRAAERSEQLGVDVHYTETSLTETAGTDAGLDATHNAAIRSGAPRPAAPN